jgi:hypothetical protein
MVTKIWRNNDNNTFSEDFPSSIFLTYTQLKLVLYYKHTNSPSFTLGFTQAQTHSLSLTETCTHAHTHTHTQTLSLSHTLTYRNRDAHTRTHTHAHSLALKSIFCTINIFYAFNFTLKPQLTFLGKIFNGLRKADHFYIILKFEIGFTSTRGESYYFVF